MNKLGIVFPGQGSQTVGMLADLATHFKIIQETFDQASLVLGYDLWQLVCEGPAQKLDQTQYTQPALLTASYAIWRLLMTNKHLKPMLLAGHSLGEYTALVCANAISFREGLLLVTARGQYMQEAVSANEGAMAAFIGLDDQVVIDICKEVAASSQRVLSPANFNSIGQVVVAGERSAVLKAMDLAKERGAKLTALLPVSVPSHCSLMQGAAQHMHALLNSISWQKPDIPIVNNVDVSCYDSSESISESLERQLIKPVRWVETIQYFIKMGITTIIECGPGKILSGLNKRIDKRLTLMTTADYPSIETILALENV